MRWLPSTTTSPAARLTSRARGLGPSHRRRARHHPTFRRRGPCRRGDAHGISGLPAGLPAAPCRHPGRGCCRNPCAARAGRREARSIPAASTSRVCGDPSMHAQPEDYWVTSARSAYEACTTKRSDAPKHTRWHISDPVSTLASRGSSNTYAERMRPDDGRAIPNFISQPLRDNEVTV